MTSGTGPSVWPLLLAAALVAVVYVGGVLVLGASLVDLDIYRMGGRAVLDGAPLYDQVGSYGLQFTYSPFAAILMVPLAALPEAVAYALWTALSILALALIVEVSMPRLPLRSLVLFVVVLVLACAVFDPVRRTLVLGQINLILCALILLDIGRREGGWRGVGVGVAAGIKLTPLLFVVFLVVTRQWAAARNALLAFAGTVLLGFALMPRTSWAYWTGIVGEADRIGPTFRFSNQSVNGLVHRSQVVPDAWTTPMWLVLSGLVVGLVMVVAKHLWENGRGVTAVATVGIGTALASPFSWTHHWVWALPLGLSVLSLAPHRPRFAMVAGGFLLMFMIRILWWPPHRHGDEFDWGPASMVVGNAWIIAALVFVALLARDAQVSGRSSSASLRGSARPGPARWPTRSSRSARSSAVRSRSADPRFSSRRSSRRVPGIGTIQGCCASSQASAT